MKQKLLDALTRQEGYVSGEQLSQSLGVSRTAIWKQIQILRELGYQIEAQPRQGYRLVERPDLLLPAEVTSGLKTSWLGHQLVYLEETDSTNEVAKRLAREGAGEGTVVVAEHQTRGKGRLGRQWISPPRAGVYFTVILRPPLTPAEAPQATLMAAVAAARGLISATGLEVRIKWPNDLLISGRKVAGILTELGADMDRIHYLVIGIGINVNIRREDLPPELNYPTTALQSELKRPVSRRRILQLCLEELESAYQGWIKNGFSPLRQQWKELSHTLGERVKVNLGEKVVEGLAEDLAEDGSLLLRQPDGSLCRLVAGEVWPSDFQR